MANSMRTKFRILLTMSIMFCLLFNGQTVFSGSKTPVEKLIIPSYVWPPFNILEDTGEWSGADVDITRDILSRMGYDAVFVQVPFKRILKEMRGGKYLGMVPCVEGGGREEYMLFSNPVASIYSVLWKKKSDKTCWTTYEDLKGRTIGASPYHYGAGFFEAAKAGKFTVNIISDESPELIHFKKLKANRVDMFICELSVGLYIQKTNSPEFDAIDYCGRGVGPTRPFSFAVSRKYFEGQEMEMNAFINRFNQELRLYTLEGKRKKVFKKYNMAVKLDDNGNVVFQEGYIDTP